MLTLAPANVALVLPGGSSLDRKNDVPFPGTLWSAGITGGPGWGWVAQLPLSLWTAHASWCSTKCQHLHSSTGVSPPVQDLCHVSLGPAVHSCCVFRRTGVLPG